MGVAANDKDNTVVRCASGLRPGDGGLGKCRDGLHPLVRGGPFDFCVSQERGPVHINVSRRARGKGWGWGLAFGTSPSSSLKVD